MDPAIIDSEPGGGTIGIDFHTSSAVLFLKNRVTNIYQSDYNSQDVWGLSGYQMNEQLSNIEGVERKVEFLQHYLLRTCSTRTMEM